jgi:hypothetical protein
MSDPSLGACDDYVSLDGSRHERDLEARETHSIRGSYCFSVRQYFKVGSALVLSVVVLTLVVHFSLLTLSSDTYGNTTSANSALPKREFRLLSPRQAEKMLLANFDTAGPVCADTASLVSQLTLMTNNAILRIRDALIGSGYSAEDAPVSGVEPGQLDAPRLDHASRWLVPNSAHPNLYKICLTGGVCGGKTAALNQMRAAFEKTWPDVLVFSVPELASVLLGLGAMNFGTFQPFVEAEHLEVATQILVLQLVYEEIWTRYAECVTAGNPNIRAMIAITDRDALSGMPFSRPIVPNAPESWEQILKGARAFLREPGLSSAMLERRYVGAVVLQTLAVMNGRLNEAMYTKTCLGKDGSNPLRKESAITAKLNDEQCEEAYAETYPHSELCLIRNEGVDFNGKVKKAAACAIRLARSAMQERPPQ